MAEARCIIYVDANPLIYAFERDPSFAQPMQALLLALRERLGTAVTSELMLGEIMVGVEKRGDAQLKRTYLDLLVRSGVIELLPVSRGILLRAAHYRPIAYANTAEPRQDHRNFYPDAIHVVTAMQARCRYFVTGDDRIRLPKDLTCVDTDKASIERLMASVR